MKFKFIQQFDSVDCGPTCIKMLAEYYGKKYPLVFLRNLSGLTKDGVSIAGIRDGLNAIGFQSKSYKISLDKLKQKFSNVPVILYWNQEHFVILYKIKRKRKRIYYYIADPAFSKYKLIEKKFCEEWLNDGLGVVLEVTPTSLFYESTPPVINHSISKFIKKYLSPFKKELFQLCLGLLSGVIISLITPFLTQVMIDKGIGEKNVNFIVVIAFAQLFLFIGGYAIDVLRNWVVLYVGTRININVLSDFLIKIMQLPMKFFETKSTGDFYQRIADHDRLQSFTTSEALMTMFSLISFSVFFIIIGLYSVKILIIYLIFSIISIGWMLFFLKKRKFIDYKLFRVRTESQNSLLEMINGMSDIKLNNYQQYKTKEWKDIQTKEYHANIDSLKVNQMQSAGYTFFNQTRNITISFLVAISVVKGELSLGMMMSISYIIGQMSSPLEQLIAFIRGFQDAKISLERAGEIHVQEDEDNEDIYIYPPTISESITLKNIFFRYGSSTDRMILSNINLKILKGRVIAIVGESGSGKTTLVKLLLKYYAPTFGDITIDNLNLDNISSNKWRSECGIVMQENYVFSDTILRNIILGDENINEKQLELAIEIANLREFISKMPMKLYTQIGNSSNGISGGERQRIMIARAVYKNPQYLFLDEATSSLDAENEKIIMTNLNRFFIGKTVIIIAHRLSTVKNADQIVVLKDGNIVELGSHKQLIYNKKYYYNLVKNQIELST